MTVRSKNGAEGFELHFDHRYAGVFVTGRRYGQPLARLNQGFADTSFWIYEAPHKTICIVIGDKHTESVANWLRAAHECAPGASFIGGILKEGRGCPVSREAYFFRFSACLPGRGAAFLRGTFAKAFAVYLPHSTELCLLVDAKLGLRLLQQYPSLPAPITGLVSVNTWRPPQNRVPSTTPYDPIAAQFHEVVNSMSAAVDEQIANTRRLWEETLEIDVPFELDCLEDELDTSIRNTVRDLDKRLTTMDTQLIMLFIQSASWTLQRVSSTCADICNYLRDYTTAEQRPKGCLTYSEVAVPSILRASRRYCEAIATRLGMDELSILPVLGEGFSVTMSMFPHLYRVGTAGHKRLVTISIPRYFRMRLGAFPILAHEVAHLRASGMRDVLENLARRQWPGRFKGSFEQLKLQDNPHTIDAIQEYEPRYRVGMSWTTEILADLLATAAAGPAYVYSFSRFTAGEPYDQNIDWKRNLTHPPIANRLLLCLDFLSYLGFDVKFSSRILEWSKGEMDEELATIVLKAVKEPYTPQQHEETRKAQESLMSGRPTPCDSVVVLNALWEAVVNNGSHINEIATLVSLQSQCTTHPLQRPAATRRGSP